MICCPNCGEKGKVERTLVNDLNEEVYRKYKCKECSHIFYTVEFEVDDSQSFRELWNKLYREQVGKRRNKND